MNGQNELRAREIPMNNGIAILRVLVLKSAGGLPRLGSRYNVDL